MGTNASVLQWACPSCEQLNPTDRKVCLRCSANRADKNVTSDANDSQNCSDRPLKVPKIMPNCLQKAKSEESAWRCENCTLLNNLDATACSSCFQEITPDPVILESYNIGDDIDLETWLCYNCQACNPVQTKTCHRCTSNRKESNAGLQGNSTNGEMGEKSRNSVGEKNWQCGACSFSLNSVTSVKCEICSTPNPAAVSGENATEAASKNDPQALPVFPDKTAAKEICGKDTPVVPSALPATEEGKRMCWRCSKCTLENSISQPSCRVCGGFRKPVDAVFRAAVVRKEVPMEISSDWVCSRCTYENKTTAHVCLMCNTKKEIMLPTEDDVAAKIPHLNGKMNEKTAADELADFDMSELWRKDSSMWTCPVCTLRNKKDVKSCTACGNLNVKEDSGECNFVLMF